MTQDFHKLASKFEPERKPKVLIVGFYHFANPGLDVVKVGLDDHLSGKRQAEIAALIAKLAAFQPTKIAVEAPFLDTKTQERYDAWLADKYILTASETEQVGFKLARQLGHKTIYPIDTHLDMDFDTFVKKAPPEVMGKFEVITEEMGKFMATFKDRPVLENIQILNSPEADRLSNGFYLRLLAGVKGDEHPGVDLISDWWKRNLYWISNLTTVAKEPADRVLVICGSGHASLIRSILRDSIDFEVVDTMKVLK